MRFQFQNIYFVHSYTSFAKIAHISI